VKMEAVCFSETLVTACQITQYHNWGDKEKLNVECREGYRTCHSYWDAEWTVRGSNFGGNRCSSVLQNVRNRSGANPVS
jgi:hypothetical protein